jgi:hypothetical protein
VVDMTTFDPQSGRPSLRSQTGAFA